MSAHSSSSRTAFVWDLHPTGAFQLASSNALPSGCIFLHALHQMAPPQSRQPTVSRAPVNLVVRHAPHAGGESPAVVIQEFREARPKFWCCRLSEFLSAAAITLNLRFVAVAQPAAGSAAASGAADVGVHASAKVNSASASMPHRRMHYIGVQL